MRCALWLGLVGPLLLSLACGDDDAPAPDGGADAGEPDAGAPDGGEPDAGPFVPTSHCPGGPGCPDEGDGVLLVGAAAVDITPTVDATTEVMTVDVNENGQYEPSDGDEFLDVNGDGEFQGVWMAGFDPPGRPASAVNDPQWVRTLVLRRDATTIALVSIDCIGFHWDDVVRIRERVAELDVDYVLVAATHTHEARDTMGQWGRGLDSTGIDPAYMERIYAAGAATIADALASARPATVQYAATRLRDQEGGTTRYVSDNRDPYILDDEIHVLRFADVELGTTIATLVNLGSHAEYTGLENTVLTSDWVHFLREGVESGLVGPDGEMVPGAGGIAIFFQGAVGSQIGPGRLHPMRWDGTVPTSRSFEVAETVGTQIAYFVLAALADDGGSVTDDTATLGFRNREVFLDVENQMLQIGASLGLFPTRALYNYDETRPISRLNEPDVKTEVAIIDIGRTQIIAVPGELDPALFLGGYDGSYTPEGEPIVDMTRENPPDLSMAPPGPYLRDLARPDAEHVTIFGLANDEIGYFVLPFDYELAAGLPYIAQPAGDHYEETNSVSPHAWPDLAETLERLLAWTP